MHVAKMFIKIMNNSAFGTTVELVKNRIELRLTTQSENAIRLCSRFNFKDSRFCNDLHILDMYKKAICSEQTIV